MIIGCFLNFLYVTCEFNNKSANDKENNIILWLFTIYKNPLKKLLSERVSYFEIDSRIRIDETIEYLIRIKVLSFYFKCIYTWKISNIS